MNETIETMKERLIRNILDGKPVVYRANIHGTLSFSDGAAVVETRIDCRDSGCPAITIKADPPREDAVADAVRAERRRILGIVFTVSRWHDPRAYTSICNLSHLIDNP